MEAHSDVCVVLEKSPGDPTESSTHNVIVCPSTLKPKPEDESNLLCEKDAVDDLESGKGIQEEIEDDNSEGNTNVSTEDPYAYIDRNGFTSEKFKIEVRGLPKFYGIGVSIILQLLRINFFSYIFSMNNLVSR